MFPGALLAAVAAVLAGSEVVFVDTATGQRVGRVALGAEGAAVFAAPDGRLVVPLLGVDATVVAQNRSEPVRWPGRLFPLFFDEFDRMHVILPGAVATLSYPERLPLSRVGVTGLAGARRAAVSSNGRLVVLIPEDPGDPALYAVITGPSGGVGRVELPAPARTLAVSPDGSWFVAGLANEEVALVAPGLSRPVASLRMGGAVLVISATADGRGFLAAVRGPGGPELLAVRVDPRAKVVMKERERNRLDAEPLALCLAGSDALFVAPAGLVVLDRHGPKRRFHVEVPGATGVAILPQRPRSTVPAWSE